MTVLTPRPKCKAVVLLPTLYFRLPETDDSIALALQAFEDRYGHGIIRRMPSTTRTTVSENPSSGPRRGGAETNVLLRPNMRGNVRTRLPPR